MSEQPQPGAYDPRYPGGHGRPRAPHPGPGALPSTVPQAAAGASASPGSAAPGSASPESVHNSPNPPASSGPVPPGGAGSSRTAAAPRGDSSPLIAPGIQPAALTTALALVLAGAAPFGSVPLAAGVALLQAVTAAGWYRLNGMWPARQGIALAFLAGIATDVTLLLAGESHTPAVLIGTLGVWCVLTLTLQLRNQSGPDERLYALTAAFTATALTVVAAGYLASLDAATADAVTVGTGAVAAAALVRTLPLPPFVSPAVALLAAAGAGAAIGQLTVLGGPAAWAEPPAGGALLGLATGGCALIGLRVASYDYPSRFVHLTAGVALPLTLAAPAVYLFGRAVA
jgi:hypothetical protein